VEHALLPENRGPEVSSHKPKTQDLAACPDSADVDSSSEGGLLQEPEDDGEESPEGDTDVSRDLYEATLNLALEPLDTPQERDAMKDKIAAEIRQEEYADTRDQKASLREERVMWDILGLEAPDAVGGGLAPEIKHKLGRLEVAIYPSQDWRQKLRYLSEWETCQP
jgi:hypothetical protein